MKTEYRPAAGSTDKKGLEEKNTKHPIRPISPISPNKSYENVNTVNLLESVILNKIIQQAGVIPFIFDKELKVMIITSKAFPDRWVLPKGHIEENHSPQETAVREAFEEAGIHGVVSDIPVGAYDYHKFNRNYHVLIYMLKITETLDSWPEQTFRKRQLLPLKQALAVLSDANVREIVTAAADLYSV